MFHLNSFVNEIKDIGRQMAEKVREPFDESNVFIHPKRDGELVIKYYGLNRNAEVSIEINAINEVTYYDPEEIKEF